MFSLDEYFDVNDVVWYINGVVLRVLMVYFMLVLEGLKGNFFLGEEGFVRWVMRLDEKGLVDEMGGFGIGFEFIFSEGGFELKVIGVFVEGGEKVSR